MHAWHVRMHQGGHARIDAPSHCGFSNTGAQGAGCATSWRRSLSAARMASMRWGLSGSSNSPFSSAAAASTCCTTSAESSILSSVRCHTTRRRQAQAIPAAGNPAGHERLIAAGKPAKRAGMEGQQWLFRGSRCLGTPVRPLRVRIPGWTLTLKASPFPPRP